MVMSVQISGSGESKRLPEGLPRGTVMRITDPDENARLWDAHSRFLRNVDWLFSHWPTVLPQGRGKYVAVAGEEPFIADTYAEARRLAEMAHPDESCGIFVHRIPATDRILIYALHGPMGTVGQPALSPRRG
jgi:hypothetical protein